MAALTGPQDLVTERRAEFEVQSERKRQALRRTQAAQAEARILATVRPGSFRPPPKVAAAVWAIPVSNQASIAPRARPLTARPAKAGTSRWSSRCLPM